MTDHRVRAGEKPEDQFTAMLESQTSSLPTSIFLGAAFASIVGRYHSNWPERTMRPCSWDSGLPRSCCSEFTTK